MNQSMAWARFRRDNLLRAGRDMAAAAAAVVVCFLLRRVVVCVRESEVVGRLCCWKAIWMDLWKFSVSQSSPPETEWN